MAKFRRKDELEALTVAVNEMTETFSARLSDMMKQLAEVNRVSKDLSAKISKLEAAHRRPIIVNPPPPKR